MNTTAFIKRNFKNQHKTTVRHHFTSTRPTAIKRHLVPSVRQQHPHELPMGTESGATAVENTPAGPRKGRGRITVRPSKSTLRYIPERNKKHVPTQKPVYKRVQRHLPLQPNTADNPSVHPRMNGQGQRGVATRQNGIGNTKK